MDGGDARFELQVNCYWTMGISVIGRQELRGDDGSKELEVLVLT